MTKTKDGIVSSVVDVSPAMAQEWLNENNNDNYRPLSLSRAARMTEAIKRGEWELNGESIKFSNTGRLLDGQHRLKAVADSGCTVQMLVVTGLTCGDAVMDLGRARSVKDILHARGYRNAPLLAGILKYMHLHESGGSMADAQRHTATHKELLAILSKHSFTRPFIHTASYAASMPRALKGAYMGYLYFQVNTQAPGPAADEFFEKLRSGEGLSANGPTSPIFQLRNRLINDASKRDRMSLRTRLALAIKAWNMFVTAQECRQLTWKPSIEGFPEIIDGEL